jgi:hypothetical protein
MRGSRLRRKESRYGRLCAPDNGIGCDTGYAPTANSCEGANSVDAGTVAALDAITSFAVLDSPSPRPFQSPQASSASTWRNCARIQAWCFLESLKGFRTAVGLALVWRARNDAAILVVERCANIANAYPDRRGAALKELKQCLISRTDIFFKRSFQNREQIHLHDEARSFSIFKKIRRNRTFRVLLDKEFGAVSFHSNGDILLESNSQRFRFYFCP